MRKIIFPILLATMLCGCDRGPQNAVYRDINNIRNLCINGHIYFAYHKGIAPLFAADSDVPMLVRCPNKQQYSMTEDFH